MRNKAKQILSLGSMLIVCCSPIEAGLLGGKKNLAKAVVMQKKAEALSVEVDRLKEKNAQLASQLKQLKEKLATTESALIAKQSAQPTESSLVGSSTVAESRQAEMSQVANRQLEKQKSSSVMASQGLKKENIEAAAHGAQQKEKRLGLGAQEKTVETEIRLYNKITTLLDRKDYQQAEESAKHYLSLYAQTQNSASVLFWLGEIKMLFGDLKAAQGYYFAALGQLKGKGRTPEVLMKIAMIAYQKGDNHEGDHYYQQLQKVYPGSTASHMARVQRNRYRTGV